MDLEQQTHVILLCFRSQVTGNAWYSLRLCVFVVHLNVLMFVFMFGDWESRVSSASYKLEHHLLSDRSSSEGKHRLKTGIVVLV